MHFPRVIDGVQKWRVSILEKRFTFSSYASSTSPSHNFSLTPPIQFFHHVRLPKTIITYCKRDGMDALKPIKWEVFSHLLKDNSIKCKLFPFSTPSEERGRISAGSALTEKTAILLFRSLSKRCSADFCKSDFNVSSCLIRGKPGANLKTNRQEAT